MDQRAQLFTLVYKAHERGLRVHLQTSGAFAVDMPIDWLTVSPKVSADDLYQISGHELLVVYDNQSMQELEKLSDTTNFLHFFLQPCWGEDGPLNTRETVEVIGALDNKWKLTIQAHKYWGIEACL